MERDHTREIVNENPRKRIILGFLVPEIHLGRVDLT